MESNEATGNAMHRGAEITPALRMKAIGDFAMFGTCKDCNAAIVLPFMRKPYPHRSVFRCDMLDAVHPHEPLLIRFAANEHGLREMPGTAILEPRHLFAGADGRANDRNLPHGVKGHRFRQVLFVIRNFTEVLPGLDHAQRQIHREHQPAGDA